MELWDVVAFRRRTIRAHDSDARFERTLFAEPARRLQGHAVRIHVRRKGEGRGLSSAVLLGFKMAK